MPRDRKTLKREPSAQQKDEIVRLYQEEIESISSIARTLDVGDAWVKRTLDQRGVPLRSAAEGLRRRIALRGAVPRTYESVA